MPDSGKRFAIENRWPMVSVHGIATTIILISALILVQGTAALTIEQAPLNPAFVAYTEGLSEGTIDQYSIDCDG